jgi:hypothetical protein
MRPQGVKSSGSLRASWIRAHVLTGSTFLRMPAWYGREWRRRPCLSGWTACRVNRFVWSREPAVWRQRRTSHYAMPRAMARHGWGLLLLVLASCAPQACFLRAAVDHAPQSVVAQHLGQPQEVWPLADGHTLWSYRTEQQLWAYWHAGRANGSTAGLTVEGPGLTVLPSAPCTEYVLRFDQRDLLRAWHRQPCRGFRPGANSNPEPPLSPYWAMKPPSITNSAPVTNDASSEARNNTP